MNVLKYKSYSGTIETSLEDECLHGKILFIEDYITYEGDTVPGLKKSFEEAVDHYLAYCKETGKPANKPCSGSFNVRVGPDLHRKAVEAAYHRRITLNEFVAQSINTAVEQNDTLRLELTHTHHHNINITDSQKTATVIANNKEPLAWESLDATN